MNPILPEYVNHIAKVLQMRERIAEQIQAQFAMDRLSHDIWQTQAIHANVQHAFLSSPFYKQHLSSSVSAYLNSGELKDFVSLPFTTRQHLNDAYPFGMLAVPREELIRFGESSGTSTGKSIAAYFTMEDWFTNNCTVAQFLKQVLSPHDVVAVAVPYELAGVGQDLDRALELINCTVVALGASTQFCSPERMVRIFRDAGVTTLICSGTRALHLAEVAQELGLNPKNDLKINKLLCAGEGFSLAKQAILRETWGAEIYSMYGMTETNTLGMFCKAQRLHLIENRLYFELIDPLTGQVSQPGETGELVVTTLSAKALPLIRYRTGDLVRIDPIPCSCCSTFRTMQHLGRASDYILVESRRISLLSLEQTILSVLKTPPYHFGVKLVDERLSIGLTENNFEPDILRNLAVAFMAEHSLEVDFLIIDKEQVSNAVRNSVKPTMQSVYLS